MNSGQKFSFQLPFIFEILRLIDCGITEYKTLQGNLGVGRNKIDAYKYYMIFADLIEYNKSNVYLTLFGELVLKLASNEKISYPLIYYKLCRGCDNGGHFYFSRLANNILFSFSNSAKQLFSSDNVKKQILNFREDIAVSNVKEEDIKSLSVQALNAIANEHTGFGKLGLVQRSKNEYEIGSFKPHYLVCAYILYDRWEKNSSTMEIEEVLNGDYNLRRLFFLTENDMNGIFSKLNQKGFIKLEVKSGLNQIVKDPNRTSEDILKEIYNEFCTH